MGIRIMDMLVVLFAGWVAFSIKFDNTVMPSAYLWATLLGVDEPRWCSISSIFILPCGQKAFLATS